MADGRDALLRYAPDAAGALGAVEQAVWSSAAAAARRGLVTRIAETCAEPHGLVPLRPPGGASGDGGLPAEAEGEAEGEAAVLTFAVRFATDVSALDESVRHAFVAAAGADAGDLAATVFAADFLPRARTALDALFGPTPPGAWSAGGPDRQVGARSSEAPGLWDALDRLVRTVPRLDALDPVTSELVRLRGARQHDCRLCRSLRSRSALRAGADETHFDAVDDHAASDLPPLARAALAFTDAMVWTPGRLAAEVVDGLRARATPAQQVELVLDVTRNALNKVAVALGADAPHVAEGVEIYDVGPDGDLLYGLPPD